MIYKEEQFSKSGLLNETIVYSIISIFIILFYSYQYILRILPNLIKPCIESTYLIDSIQFGDFAGIYYLGYVIFHIPFGYLLFRYGGKMILPITIFLTSVGVVPILLKMDWIVVVIGRFISGVGSSCAGVAAFQYFRIFYPDKYARAIGVMVFFGLCFAKFANEYFFTLVSFWGIETIFRVIFLFGFLLSILTYIFFPKVDLESGESTVFKSFFQNIMNKRLVLLSLSAGLMVGSLEGFGDAWASAFLINSYKIEKSFADYLTSYIFIGMAIGSLILPYISDKYNTGYQITLISSLAMLVILSTVLYSNSISYRYLLYLFFLLGFFCAYQSVTITLISSYVEPSKSGLLSTIVNMVIMFFGTIFHKLISLFVKHFSSYQVGLSIVVIALGISLLCLVYIYPKKIVTKQC